VLAMDSALIQDHEMEAGYTDPGIMSWWAQRLLISSFAVACIIWLTSLLLPHTLPGLGRELYSSSYPSGFDQSGIHSVEALRSFPHLIPAGSV
jgi:hypothetical protein